MATPTNLQRLVDECISDGNLYLNLDTNRKNKESTVKNKKDIYISHNFRVFSKDRETISRTLSSLQTFYPTLNSDIIEIGNKSNNNDNNDDEIDITYDVIANAFGTINRLLINPLKYEKQSKSEYSAITALEGLFKNMSINDSSSSTASSSGSHKPKSYLKSTQSRPKSVPYHGVQMKQPPKQQTKQPPKQQTKQQTKQQMKQQPKQQMKQQPPKQQTKQQPPKQQMKQQPKQQTKQQQPKQQMNSKNQSIPALTRSQVWRKWCGNLMDGNCFCCDETIKYEKWHCGHVIAREHGGSVDSDNLRPTCTKCNLGMGTLHMYEWILMNRLSGYRHLDPSDAVVKRNFTIVQATAKTAEKISWLEDNGHLTKTQANGYRRRIVSKRSNIETRIEIMEEISEKYKLHLIG